MYLLGLGAVEVVAGVESGITYQVSWGVVPAKMSDPPKPVEAKTTEQQPPLIEAHVQTTLIVPTANGGMQALSRISR